MTNYHDYDTLHVTSNKHNDKFYFHFIHIITGWIWETHDMLTDLLLSDLLQVELNDSGCEAQEGYCNPSTILEKVSA
jgi:hypothetical protein